MEKNKNIYRQISVLILKVRVKSSTIPLIFSCFALLYVHLGAYTYLILYVAGYKYSYQHSNRLSGLILLVFVCLIQCGSSVSMIYSIFFLLKIITKVFSCAVYTSSKPSSSLKCMLFFILEIWNVFGKLQFTSF